MNSYFRSFLNYQKPVTSHFGGSVLARSVTLLLWLKSQTMVQPGSESESGADRSRAVAVEPRSKPDWAAFPGCPPGMRMTNEAIYGALNLQASSVHLNQNASCLLGEGRNTLWSMTVLSLCNFVPVPGSLLLDGRTDERIGCPLCEELIGCPLSDERIGCPPL